jgi:hypothetical protein
MRFSKAFTVKGNIERAFELTEKYVQGMKFNIKNSVHPTLLVLERGSRWGSFASTKIENVKTTLTISFKQINDDVSILCDYDLTVYGIATSSDKSTLESEVEKLKHFLVTGLTSK